MLRGHTGLGERTLGRVAQEETFVTRGEPGGQESTGGLAAVIALGRGPQEIRLQTECGRGPGWAGNKGPGLGWDTLK